MKTITTMVAAAVAVTGPASVCYAQSSYDDCIAMCEYYYQQDSEHCGDYQNQLDQEYCWMAASSSRGACVGWCDNGGTSLAALSDRPDHRYRPVEMKVPAKARLTRHV